MFATVALGKQLARGPGAVETKLAIGERLILALGQRQAERFQLKQQRLGVIEACAHRIAFGRVPSRSSSSQASAWETTT